MVYKCVAFGCSNTSNRERRISLHLFPTSPTLRKIWSEKVRRKNWKPTENSHLCSEHFETSCFVVDSSIVASIGFSDWIKPSLKTNAVPTIFSYSAEDSRFFDVGLGLNLKRSGYCRGTLRRTHNEKTILGQGMTFGQNMPPKKYINEDARKAADAERKRKKRANASEEQRRQSRAGDAERKRRSRTNFNSIITSDQEHHRHMKMHSKNADTDLKVVPESLSASSEIERLEIVHFNSIVTSDQEHHRPMKMHSENADTDLKVVPESLSASSEIERLEIVHKIKEEPLDHADNDQENSQLEDVEKELQAEFILPDQLSEISNEYTSENEAVIPISVVKTRLRPNSKVRPPYQEKVPIQCSMCKKEFTRRNHLKRHVEMTRCSGHLAPGHKCELCGKVYRRKDNLKTHLRSHLGEPRSVPQMKHTCSYCGKQYSHIGPLTIHIRMHTGEKPFPCDFCEKKFASSGLLTLHLRKHTGEKPFVCDLCEKRFSSKSLLTVHQRQHTGETPFACHLCELSFPSKNRLKWHLAKHTGDKPFHCTGCDSRFINKGSLKRHMQRFGHGDITGTRPFECGVCGKGFMLFLSLKGHLLSHSDQEQVDSDEGQGITKLNNENILSSD